MLELFELPTYGSQVNKYTDGRLLIHSTNSILLGSQTHLSVCPVCVSAQAGPHRQIRADFLA